MLFGKRTMIAKHILRAIHEIGLLAGMDTVNLAPTESLDLIMDFTDPIIRGVSVFHCHLLKHEDKGMMAKILFE